MMVVPLARTAAIMIFSVPVTVGAGKAMGAMELVGTGSHIALRQFQTGTERLQALQMKITGLAPMAHPPGSDTRA